MLLNPFYCCATWNACESTVPRVWVVPEIATKLERERSTKRRRKDCESTTRTVPEHGDAWSYTDVVSGKSMYYYRVAYPCPCLFLYWLARESL